MLSGWVYVTMPLFLIPMCAGQILFTDGIHKCFSVKHRKLCDSHWEINFSFSQNSVINEENCLSQWWLNKGKGAWFWENQKNGIGQNEDGVHQNQNVFEGAPEQWWNVVYFQSVYPRGTTAQPGRKGGKGGADDRDKEKWQSR